MEPVDDIDVFNGMDLCSLCSAFSFISDILWDEEGLHGTLGCIFKREVVEERVPKCKRFIPRKKFMKLACPQCRNDLFIDIPRLEEDLSLAVSKIIRCPSCQVNLRITIVTEQLPSTLEDWKKIAEMNRMLKRRDGEELEVTPAGRVQTKCKVQLYDPFLNEESEF